MTKISKRRLRQLPPTAVPVSRADLWAGLHPTDGASSQFINDLAKTFGVDPQACVTASSGRTALYYLLQGLKFEGGSRSDVIMPAYTCPALAKVTLDLGLTPVFVDIDPYSTQYKETQLQDALSANTLAVILVHPFGIPLPIGTVLEMARSVEATVIEDAAQAMGAKWAGKLVGTQGDFGLFSLGPGKPISTGGGGIVIANDPKDVPRLQAWWQAMPKTSKRQQGGAWLRQAAFQAAFHPAGWWTITRTGLHRVGNHEASWGYSLSSLTSTQAAIGSALLDRMVEINYQRLLKGRIIDGYVSGSDVLKTVAVPAEAEAIFLRYPLLASDEKQRNKLYDAFWSAGIGAGRLYEKTLPAIYTPNTLDQFPGAESFARRLVTLPTHHYMDDEDLKTIKQIIETA